MSTTNYTVAGEGEFFKGRMFEVEFSEHYSSSYQPIHAFGIRFFDNWNNEEWYAFCTFMLQSVQFYLNNRLVEYESASLKRKKLEQMTSIEFCAFADKIERNIEYDKKELFDKFIEENSDFPNMQKTFNSFLLKYCSHYIIQLKERNLPERS